MTKKIIRPPGAPEPIGPYHHAVEAAGLIFCSGQIPLDPQTGQLVPGGIREQTEQVLANLRAVLAGAGVGFEAVLKTTIFLADLGDFGVVNEVYGRCFASEAPARSTVQVAALPRGARVEIEAVARARDGS